MKKNFGVLVPIVTVLTLLALPSHCNNFEFVGVEKHTGHPRGCVILWNFINTQKVRNPRRLSVLLVGEGGVVFLGLGAVKQKRNKANWMKAVIP